MNQKCFWLACGLALAGGAPVFAGDPFVTDDPIPTDYHNWDVTFSARHTKSAGTWSGAVAQVEVDYGAISNLQLHCIAPVVYHAARGSSAQAGCGDLELGVKFRFLTQTETLPDLAVDPTVGLPTGNETHGLGCGHVRLVLPLWAQKDFGAWTAYGGGCWCLNPGAGNCNWGMVGAVLGRHLTENIFLGAEIFHSTADTPEGGSDTACNLGVALRLNNRANLLLSVGRSLAGPTDFQGYVGMQFSFGP